MISIREIADLNTKISSTRWAFAIIIIFDMIMIASSVVAFVVCHLLGKTIDESFLYAVATILGAVTGITGTAKALQGFENGHEKIEESTKEEKSE